MLLKLFIPFFFYTSLFSLEYPQTYAQLGTPLYTSLQPFLELKKSHFLESEIETYQRNLKKSLADGYHVDITQNSLDRRVYLKELRVLKKEYERLLFYIHQALLQAIESKDFKLFTKLTEYKFDGFLQKRALKNRVIAFYIQHKKYLKSKLLEEEINHRELLLQTRKYFEEVAVENSFYTPNNKRVSTKKVSIETERKRNKIYVTLKNDNIYPITLSVNAYYKNIISLEPTQDEIVLQAKSHKRYTTLEIMEDESYYKYSFSWIMGSKDAEHKDNYIYTLPYAVGTSHPVSQGYHGSYTHKGRSAYSIDFPMKEGTAIYASRGGLVVKIKSNSKSGGYDRKYASSGNYVRILHKDGTLATYYHLQYRGVVVKEGEYVEQKKLLGYSGNTGYTSGPHLHFSVFKAISASQTQTIPVKIITTEGVMERLERGVVYEAK